MFSRYLFVLCVYASFLKYVTTVEGSRILYIENNRDLFDGKFII